MASIHDLCNPEPDEDRRRADYPPATARPPHAQHPAPFHQAPDPQQAYPRQYAEHGDYSESPPRSHHSHAHDRHPQHHPQHYQPYPQPPLHHQPQPYKQRPAAPAPPAPPPPHHHQHPSSSHHYHEQPPYDGRHPYPPLYPGNTPSRSSPPPHAHDHYPSHPSQKGYHEDPRGRSRERPRGYSSGSSRAPPAPIPIPAPTAAPSASASGPSSAGAYPEHRSIKMEQAHPDVPRRSSTLQDERPAKIKIVQQPLHARMCGFGEKDRRPVDPPPIVQLLLDEDHEHHPSKRAQRSNASAKKALLSSASNTATSKPTNRDKAQEPDEDENSHGDNEEEDESYQLEEEEEEGGPAGKRGPTNAAGRRSSVRTTRGRAGSLKQEQTAPGFPPSLGKRGRPSGGPSSTNKVKRSGSVDNGGDESSHSDHSNDDGSDGEGQGGDDHAHHDGQLSEQDPLFVLHVSLWSANGKEVRNMIATPGQSEPPKLTRILMGSLVVSPILLNNPEGVPGWYFSFPDLSIRTEGMYTLKFSLMRFGSFDFLNSEDGHATTLVAEETSEPFTVFSAKKFPGMTESTELSKAFAKQGLKIPIRNDLRARKVDKD